MIFLTFIKKKNKDVLPLFLNAYENYFFIERVIGKS